MLMSRRRYLLATAIALAGPSARAPAHEYKAGALAIIHPWVRAVPGSMVAAGYVTIANAGPSADRLIGGSLTGAAAGELHATTKEGGVERMRPVEGGLEIKPWQTVR